MDAVITAGLIGVGGTLAGTALGWVLTDAAARRSRLEEREHQRRTRVRERQVEVAQELDEALLAVSSRLPVLQSGRDAAAALWEAHTEWQRAWSRTRLLRDDALLERYRVVGLVLFMAQNDEQHERRYDPRVVGRAISAARQAIAAFLREEEPPAPSFPDRDELKRLCPSSARGYDYSALRSWLDGHPEEPPNRPTAQKPAG